ncbi:hypothetical protein HK104_002333 [Borealophlyctis nickersoniae]|nr:hypothetical protein HK104_002333 [Borealophlyctis nickersoniae]
MPLIGKGKGTLWAADDVGALEPQKRNLHGVGGWVSSASSSSGGGGGGGGSAAPVMRKRTVSSESAKRRQQQKQSAWDENDEEKDENAGKKGKSSPPLHRMRNRSISSEAGKIKSAKNHLDTKPDKPDSASHPDHPYLQPHPLQQRRLSAHSVDSRETLTAVRGALQRQRSSIGKLDLDAVLAGKFDNNPKALLGHLAGSGPSAGESVQQDSSSDDELQHMRKSVMDRTMNRGGMSRSSSDPSMSRQSSGEKVGEMVRIFSPAETSGPGMGQARRSVSDDGSVLRKKRTSVSEEGERTPPPGVAPGVPPNTRGRRMSISSVNPAIIAMVAGSVSSGSGRKKEGSGSPRLSGGSPRQSPRLSVGAATRLSVMEERSPGETARYRWKWCITLTRKLLRSSSLFRVGPGAGNIGGGGQPDSMAGYLAGLSQRDNILNGNRIANTLAMKVADRTPAQERQLDSLLCHMPSFARLGSNIRYELAKSALYLGLGPDRTVIRRGLTPLFVYYLFTGACSSVEPTDARHGGDIVKSLKAGEMFGNFPFSAPDQPRPATITTIMPCELIAIPREAYIQAMTGTQQQEFQHVIGHFLRSVPPFEKTPESVVEELVKLGQVVEYEMTTVILPPNERRYFFILLDGKCRAFRSVPIKGRGSSTGSTHTRHSAGSDDMTPKITLTDDSLTPRAPRATPPPGASSRTRRASLTPNWRPREPSISDDSQAPQQLLSHSQQQQQPVYETLSVGELHPRDYFPPLRLARAEVMEMRAAHVSAENVAVLRTATRRQDGQGKDGVAGVGGGNVGMMTSAAGGETAGDDESLALGLDITVKSLQRVECFRIPRVDLLRVVDTATVSRLVSTSCEGTLGVSIQELQENYAAARAWSDHRRSVVAEVVNDVKGRRGSILH